MTELVRNIITLFYDDEDEPEAEECWSAALEYAQYLRDKNVINTQAKTITRTP